MRIKTIRVVLIATIVLLVTSELLSWALGLFGALGGGVGADSRGIAVMLVTP